MRGLDNARPVTTHHHQEEQYYNIISLTEYGYEFREKREQNSRYLNNAARQELYRQYLESGEGKGIRARAAEGHPVSTEERQRYNSCQKALAICEAAAQFPDVEDKEHHQEEQSSQKPSVRL